MTKNTETVAHYFEMRRFENGELVETRVLAPSTDSDEAQSIIMDERGWFEGDESVQIRLFLVKTKVIKEVLAEAEIEVG